MSAPTLCRSWSSSWFRATSDRGKIWSRPRLGDVEREDEKGFARRRLVQRKAANGDAATVGVPGQGSLSAQLPSGSNGPYTGSLFGGGSALPATLQRKFEGSLGADLSGVRVHTGAESAQSARSLSARAYTVGNDIHFGAGQYDPSSPAGEHLLAHEVAHTVQQAGAGPSVQHKLEVSQPGDACELEADSAADAMLSGARFSISPAAGVQRSIMRTPDDGPAHAPRADGGRESATGGGGAPTGSDAGRMVNTTWTINYDQVHTGNGAAARARTGDMALHVTYFGIHPDAGTVTPNTPFSGYNLQPAGRVTMGSRMHPQGQGGEASAAVSYVRRRTVAFHVDGERAALAAHGGRAALERAVRSAISARVGGAVDSGLFDDASLTQLLPEAARAAGIHVRAGSPESERAVLNTEPLRYPAINRDGQQMHVTVNVPNAEFVARATSEGEHEQETTTGGSEATTSREGEDTTITREIARRFATSVRRSFDTEVTSFAQTATEWFFSGRQREAVTRTLRGEGEGTLTTGVDGQVPLSAVVAAAGMPELALLIPDSAHISASVTGALRLLLGFELRHEIDHELLSSHRTTHTAQLQTAIRTGLMRQWDSEMSARFAREVHVSEGHEHTESRRGSERTLEHGRSERSTEGHGSSSSAARPTLVLGNTVAGPEAPRVPTRIE